MSDSVMMQKSAISDSLKNPSMKFSAEMMRQPASYRALSKRRISNEDNGDKQLADEPKFDNTELQKIKMISNQRGGRSLSLAPDLMIHQKVLNPVQNFGHNKRSNLMLKAQ